ncbi:MAG: polyphosphate polymerase domain-containing protein [Planctomycetota bacterium]|nr:polyphosphate polymerase domain-containing protein [Planctomycetota bacterium]
MNSARVIDCPTRFDLIDVGETRSDLASRREVKFAIECMDVGKLQRLLEVNCQRQVHGHQVSEVRSIYFDNATLSACRANLNGNGHRRKLRLRWYDSLLPGNSFFVEVKWRSNRITGKHRFEFRSDIPLKDLSYQQIHRNLEQSMPQQLIGDVLANYDSVVIVEYKREHFVTNDGLRLTLDYDLTYYDQAGQTHITARFPRRVDGLIVLEGKTPIGRESELRRWLHPFTPRATRCSKYVLGCQQVGRILASEL